MPVVALKMTAFPSLERVAPSIVFARTAALMPEEDGGEIERRKAAQQVLELVEWSAAHANLREFVEPAEPLVRTSREDIERVVVSFATMISVIEYGALARALVTSPDLAKRFQAVRDTALVKLKGTRAILVAALENDDGAKRNETPEQRLQRSIETAKTEAPLDIGSFASYAELPDDPADQR
jgi:hypothetical protein